MNDKSIFMSLGTSLGMLLGLIITVYLLLTGNDLSTYSIVIILVLSVLFRIIGYILDKIASKKDS